MIKRIADKAGVEMTAKDQNKITRKFKLLNTAYLGIRKLHTDQQGVARPDSGIESGTILTLANAESLIVSTSTNDYHRGEIIRFALDLVECNNFVTVTRSVVNKTSQGGIAGHTDTVLYRGVPVKIGTILQIRDTDNDASVSQFGMLLSTKFPVIQGDSLSFDKHYEDAKVEGVKLNYEGIYEITFDRDPRWT
jgi:hypothetical protein